MNYEEIRKYSFVFNVAGGNSEIRNVVFLRETF
jgi:hypothetical protein